MGEQEKLHNFERLVLARRIGAPHAPGCRLQAITAAWPCELCNSLPGPRLRSGGGGRWLEDGGTRYIVLLMRQKGALGYVDGLGDEVDALDITEIFRRILKNRYCKCSFAGSLMDW